MNVSSQSFFDALNTIEKNNLELQAEKKYVESKSLEYKAANLPEGPEISYGYFPNNSTVPGTKEVFEISQSFQMPGYYTNFSAYSKFMISAEELNYKVSRQKILAESKKLLIDYVFLMKRLAIAENRLKFASNFFNASLVRMELGDINSLEVNKAKLHLMKVQKEEKEIRSELIKIKEKLKQLNGGEELNIDIEDYPAEGIASLDSVLFEKMESDSELLLSQKQYEASQKQLKVVKNLQLPSFSLGYGTETVADEQFKGVMVGVSIPLWSSKKNIQNAKLNTEYHDLNKGSIAKAKIAETRILYYQAGSLKESLESYEKVLSSVNNEALLKQSLESGEISIIDFFTEMFYYYEIYDDYLMLERDYYQSLNELYKYRL